MIRSSPGLTIAWVSSPAKADDPVFREAQVQQRPSRNTGSPAYAGYVALTFILPAMQAKGTPTPPPSLRSGTLSHKGRGEEASRAMTIAPLTPPPAACAAAEIVRARLT